MTDLEDLLQNDSMYTREEYPVMNSFSCKNVIVLLSHVHAVTEYRKYNVLLRLLTKKYKAYGSQSIVLR